MMESRNRRDKLQELPGDEQRGPSAWLIVVVVIITASALLFPFYG
jgi:hypothetical protein